MKEKLSFLSRYSKILAAITALNAMIETVASEYDSDYALTAIDEKGLIREMASILLHLTKKSDIDTLKDIIHDYDNQIDLPTKWEDYDISGSSFGITYASESSEESH